MIRAMCRHLSLTEALGESGATAYQESVRPIDYEFGLLRGGEYQVVGLREDGRTTWWYVASLSGEPYLEVVPAVLFEAVSPSACGSMVMELLPGAQPSMEIVPECFARLDRWFERYLDDDEVATRVVRDEILRQRK
jgi:hypothetical protein